MDNTLITKYLLKHPSLLIVLGVLTLFTLSVVVLAEGFGLGLVSTSFVKTLGKTLCLCIIDEIPTLSHMYKGCHLTVHPC